jgi:hypothetical protein
MGRLQALPKNIRQTLTNTLAYYMSAKCFIV